MRLLRLVTLRMSGTGSGAGGHLGPSSKVILLGAMGISVRGFLRKGEGLLGGDIIKNCSSVESVPLARVGGVPRHASKLRLTLAAPSEEEQLEVFIALQKRRSCDEHFAPREVGNDDVLYDEALGSIGASVTSCVSA